MECDSVKTYLADHLAGSLPPATADEVATHLRSCEACATEYESIEDTWQRLRTLPALRPDSAAMRTRFAEALESYELGLDQAVAHRRSMSSYGLQFAAAAAVLVVGVLIGREMVTPSSAPAAGTDAQLAQLREELRDMREMFTLSLLQQQSATDRLKGVGFSTQVDDPGTTLTTALLDTLMHDPNASVRLRTVAALERFADRADVRRAALQALPRETAPLVQIALIDYVVKTSPREAAATLRQIVGDSMANEDVRMHAERRLAQLG